MPKITVTFDKQKCLYMLKNLPDRIQRRVLRQVAGPASTPVLKAAKRLCPKDTGTLKKSLKRKIKTYTKTNTVVCIIGPDKSSEAAFYAHLVEDGAKPHQITMHLKDGRTITVQHPGARASKWLERAEASGGKEGSAIAAREMPIRTIREAEKLGN